MDTLKFEVLMAVIISLVCDTVLRLLETQSESFFETPAFTYQSAREPIWLTK